MKKLLCIVACLLFVLPVLLSGCQMVGTQATPEPTQGESHVLRAGGPTFTSLEAMTEAIQKAKRSLEERTEARLEDVEYYYLPTYLPEGYNLYQITVGGLTFEFTYIKAENPQSIGEEELAQIGMKQEGLVFWFNRDIEKNQMESAISANRKTKEDLIDGKYLYLEDPQELYWEEGGHIQKLYIPNLLPLGDFLPEDVKQAFTKEEVLSFGYAKRVDMPKE